MHQRHPQTPEHAGQVEAQVKTATAQTVLDSKLTDCLEFFIAITAAMKNVLSPISETKIIPHDFKNPVARPPANKVVMLMPVQDRSAKFSMCSAQTQVAACGLWPNFATCSCCCLLYNTTFAQKARWSAGGDPNTREDPIVCVYSCGQRRRRRSSRSVAMRPRHWVY